MFVFLSLFPIGRHPASSRSQLLQLPSAAARRLDGTSSKQNSASARRLDGIPTSIKSSSASRRDDTPAPIPQSSTSTRRLDGASSTTLSKSSAGRRSNKKTSSHGVELPSYFKLPELDESQLSDADIAWKRKMEERCGHLYSDLNRKVHVPVLIDVSCKRNVSTVMLLRAGTTA